MKPWGSIHGGHGHRPPISHSAPLGGRSNLTFFLYFLQGSNPPLSRPLPHCYDFDTYEDEGGGKSSSEVGKLERWEVGKMGSCKVAKLGSWEAAKLGSWDAAKLGSWKVAKLGSWDAAMLGSWKVVKPVGWDVGRVEG